MMINIFGIIVETYCMKRAICLLFCFSRLEKLLEMIWMLNVLPKLKITLKNFLKPLRLI